MYNRLALNNIHNFYFDDDGYYVQSSKAQEGTLPPRNATRTPPFILPENKINFYNTELKDWEVHEDNRQKMDERGRIVEFSGVPYWTEGDNYQSEPRYMISPGKLPENCILNRPERTLDVIKNEMIIECNAITKSKMINGFNYTINNIEYKFDYDPHDQQNLSDAYNKSITPPDEDASINGVYIRAKDANGNAVRLNLSIETMKDLYLNGAYPHKEWVLFTGDEMKNSILLMTAETKNKVLNELETYKTS